MSKSTVTDQQLFPWLGAWRRLRSTTAFLDWRYGENTGADSMGAIAPTAEKLWGDSQKSPPWEFYVTIVHIQKGTVKLRMCYYESKKVW